MSKEIDALEAEIAKDEGLTLEKYRRRNELWKEIEEELTKNSEDDKKVLKLFKEFVKEGFDPNHSNGWGFDIACSAGLYETVKYLLTLKSIDPTNDEYYGLREAIEGNKLNIVKIILKDKRVDPMALSGKLFRICIKYKRKGILIDLLKHPKTDIKELQRSSRLEGSPTFREALKEMKLGSFQKFLNL